MNNTKKHISSYLKEINKQDKKDKEYPYSFVKHIDFDLEVESLKYQLKIINDKLAIQEKIIENINFGIVVLATLLEDNKIINKNMINNAAKKVSLIKTTEIETYKNNKNQIYKDLLFNNEIKPIDA